MRLLPRDAATRARLGSLYESAGLRDEAFNEYLQALELDPDCGESGGYSARARYLFGELTDAVFHFRRALLFDGRNACLWNDMAAACAEAGQVEESRRIERFSGLAEIIIVDNGSTYAPLLDWYAALPHQVIRLPNVVHKAPWLPEVKNAVRTDFYVVTDPDLALAVTPDDCLLHLRDRLEHFPAFGKVGLALSIDDVPAESPYFRRIGDWERSLWKPPVVDGIRRALVDTTFAIYDRRGLNSHCVCEARTDHPYTARHLPWWVITPDSEFQFYLARANASSSFKTFVLRD